MVLRSLGVGTYKLLFFLFEFSEVPHLQFIELVACGDRLLRSLLCKFLEVNGLLNIGMSLSCAP